MVKEARTKGKGEEIKNGNKGEKGSRMKGCNRYKGEDVVKRKQVMVMEVAKNINIPHNHALK